MTSTEKLFGLIETHLENFGEQHQRALLQVPYGEDEWLHGAEYSVFFKIVGELPRPEFASRESVLEALPLIKRWLPYRYDREADAATRREAEERGWRELCELARPAIDYDSVQPEAAVHRPSRHD